MTLQRENHELRQATEILCKASACFARESAALAQDMIAFIDVHRDDMDRADPARFSRRLRYRLFLAAGP